MTEMTMKPQELRNILIKIMLGGLVLAAIVAVVTILIGDFNEITSRALSTVAVAIFYTVLMLGIVSIAAPKGNVEHRSSEIVINLSIVLAVLSFLTSIFGIWELLEIEITLKLYFTYTVLLVALLHAKFLFDIQLIYAKIRPYIYANYAFIVLLSVLLLGYVYASDHADLLSGFYGRLLAASALVNATLSIIVGVMNHLYLQQHPDLKASSSHQGASLIRIILILLAFFFIVFPIFGWILGSL